jgi:hypothetical protein
MCGHMYKVSIVVYMVHSVHSGYMCGYMYIVAIVHKYIVVTCVATMYIVSIVHSVHIGYMSDYTYIVAMH